ncbi:MAG: DUF423 domain-containing protein [Bradymonadia bacterium]
MGFVAAGALALALGVAAGAFGAHGLKNTLSADLLAIWETGARYHLVHGLGLVLVGILAPQLGRSVRVVGWLLVAGIVFFSGSLYLLALTDTRWLGAVTPIGGTAWIAAWITLAVGALKARSSVSGS